MVSRNDYSFDIHMYRVREKYPTEQTTILNMDASIVHILNILHEINITNCEVAWRGECVFWIMYLTLYNTIFELIMTQ